MQEPVYESVDDVILNDMKDDIDRELLSGVIFDEEMNILLDIDESSINEIPEE